MDLFHKQLLEKQKLYRSIALNWIKLNPTDTCSSLTSSSAYQWAVWQHNTIIPQRWEHCYCSTWDYFGHNQQLNHMRIIPVPVCAQLCVIPEGAPQFKMFDSQLFPYLRGLHGNGIIRKGILPISTRGKLWFRVSVWHLAVTVMRWKRLKINSISHVQ